ncbi:MAG: hypothetical protein Q8930_12220 [Bacillota bacterium]|nr:hypothetical protein [Bacillota bacterium]
MFFSKLMHDAAGADFILSLAGIIYAVISVIFILLRSRNESIQRLIYCIFFLLAGSTFICNLLIGLFFYSSGRYFNPGIAGLIYIFLSLSISTTSMYYVTRKFFLSSNPANLKQELIIFIFLQPPFIILIYILLHAAGRHYA